MNTSSPDFPLWLPSALVKELRQGLRTPSFCLLSCIFPALMALLFFFSFLDDPDGEPIVGQQLCGNLLWVALLISLLLVMPLRAMTTVRMELTTRNHELLLLTRQTAGRIVLGKWISMMAQALLIIFISLPFFIVRYYYGQIDLFRDLTMLFTLYLGSGILTAFALWAASQPPLLRGITMIGMVVAIIQATSLLLGYNEVDELWSGLLLSGLLLADASLVIATMLLLARRYFAPVAQNSASALRLLLLAFLSANLLLILMLGGHPETLEKTMQPHAYFLIIYGVFLLVIHVNTPEELMPAHVAQMQGKRFSLLRQLLLLPGLPPAVFFAFLLAMMSVAQILALNWPTHGASTLSLSSPFLICLATSGWYALVAPLFLLWPFRNKLKQYMLLGYLLIWVPLGLLLSVLGTMHLFIPCLPGNALIALLQLENKEAVHDDLILQTIAEAAFVAILLALFTRSWFARRREAARSAGKSLPDSR